MKTAEHTLFAQIFLVSTLWFILKETKKQKTKEELHSFNVVFLSLIIFFIPQWQGLSKDYKDNTQFVSHSKHIPSKWGMSLAILTRRTPQTLSHIKPNFKKKIFFIHCTSSEIRIFYRKVLWRFYVMNKRHHNLTSYFGRISLPSHSHKNGQFTYNTSQPLDRQYNKLNCFIYPEAYKEKPNTKRLPVS